MKRNIELLILVIGIFTIIFITLGCISKPEVSSNSIIEINFKQPYSYYIYTDGTNIFEKNGITGQVAIYTYFSDALKNATSNINEGSIFISNATYVPTSEVKSHTGVSFVGDHAIIDLSAYDGTFLNITGCGNYLCDNYATQFKGFKVTGNIANLNTLFLNVTDVARSVVIQDITHQYVANMIKINGATFDADISNVNGFYLTGTWINISSSSTQRATHATIHNSELSNPANDDTYNNSIGINLQSTSQDIQGVKIDSNWIENVKNCIIDNASYTTITNNHLVCYAGKNTEGDGIRIDRLHNEGAIANNINWVGMNNSRGINISQANSIASSVISNTFKFTYSLYPNPFAEGVHGNNTITTIVGNTFHGGSVNTQATGINITPRPSGSNYLATTVIGNAFYTINSTISNSSNVIAIGNTYYSVGINNNVNESLNYDLILRNHNLTARNITLSGTPGCITMIGEDSLNYMLTIASGGTTKITAGTCS